MGNSHHKSAGSDHSEVPQESSLLSSTDKVSMGLNIYVATFVFLSCHPLYNIMSPSTSEPFNSVFNYMGNMLYWDKISLDSCWLSSPVIYLHLRMKCVQYVWETCSIRLISVMILRNLQKIVLRMHLTQKVNSYNVASQLWL